MNTNPEAVSDDAIETETGSVDQVDTVSQTESEPSLDRLETVSESLSENRMETASYGESERLFSFFLWLTVTPCYIFESVTATFKPFSFSNENSLQC